MSAADQQSIHVGRQAGMAWQRPEQPIRHDLAETAAPGAAISPGALRRTCGLFVTGVTVITTGTGARAAGATVNSFTSVSLEPPLVLFCLHERSRLHETLAESGAFTVNFLAGWQEGVARAFAGRDTAVFHHVEHHVSTMGVPVLSDVLAFLACRIVDRFVGGDHVIILGEVVELGEPRWHREPLIFFQGAFGALERDSPAHSQIPDG